jgi:hypothetical protein
MAVDAQLAGVAASLWVQKAGAFTSRRAPRTQLRRITSSQCIVSCYTQLQLLRWNHRVPTSCAVLHCSCQPTALGLQGVLPCSCQASLLNCRNLYYNNRLQAYMPTFISNVAVLAGACATFAGSQAVH